MSILYPIDKPVTPDDIRDKARDMLNRTGEWTPWETDVLRLVAAHADAIHGHYMRHVWYEVEDLGEPDAQASRDEVMTAIDVVLQAIGPEHAKESALYSRNGSDISEIDPGEALASLLVHGAEIVDDLVLSLRRGPTAIDGDHLHGFTLETWTEFLHFSDAKVRLPFAEPALQTLENGLAAAVDATEEAVDEAMEALQLRTQRQKERNDERVAAAIALTNENYNLPTTFALRQTGAGNDHITLAWGTTDEPPAGTEEVRTRPSGRETVQLQRTTLGEVHPMAIADIARAGRFAALSVGRDAEIRSTGSPLSEPPVWAWAGPLPLVRHVLSRLRAGEDVDVTKEGMSAGPLLSASRIELGDGSAVYAYNVRTLDESLTLDQRIPDTLAHACIGNPLSAIIQAPMFNDPRVTVQACETGDDGTDFDILSPVIRLVPAPDGYEQDPESAWLAMLNGFDEMAVYGHRVYRRVNEELNGPLDG